MHPALIWAAIATCVSGVGYWKRRAIKNAVRRVKNWVTGVFAGMACIVLLLVFIKYVSPLSLKIISAWFNLSVAAISQNISMFLWSFAGIIALIAAAFFAGQASQRKKYKRQQQEQKRLRNNLGNKIKGKMKNIFNRSKPNHTTVK